MGVDSIYVQVTLSERVDMVPTTHSIVDDLLVDSRHEVGPNNEPSDGPPVANAGPDMVVHHPQETSVTLDGSASSDDKVRMG
jgi:hypothetical protein